MIPVGITELEGVLIAALPDDVVIPVELVGNGIPPLGNVPVIIEEGLRLLYCLRLGSMNTSS